MFSDVKKTQRWRIRIDNLETQTAVGIHAHERTPQRVLVSAMIEGRYAFPPQSIEDCFDYETVYRFVAGQWPGLPHTPLLEQRVAALLAHIFTSDARVEYARVSVSKPDIFPEAASVGVEAEWTRGDFERLATMPRNIP